MLDKKEPNFAQFWSLENFDFSAYDLLNRNCQNCRGGGGG